MDDHPYLDGKPEGFVKSCDVLLKLDDGSQLPAHSHILTLHSKVCADMLDDGPLSAASALKKVELPLTDCSKDTAVSLLEVLYSYQPVEEITQDNSMAIAGLAHKLDMKVPDQR